LLPARSANCFSDLIEPLITDFFISGSGSSEPVGRNNPDLRTALQFQTELCLIDASIHVLSDTFPHRHPDAKKEGCFPVLANILQQGEARHSLPVTKIRKPRGLDVDISSVPAQILDTCTGFHNRTIWVEI